MWPFLLEEFSIPLYKYTLSNKFFFAFYVSMNWMSLKFLTGRADLKLLSQSEASGLHSLIKYNIWLNEVFQYFQVVDNNITNIGPIVRGIYIV